MFDSEHGARVMTDITRFLSESKDLGFNVYRQVGSATPLKLNDQPLTAGTNFIDRNTKLDDATSYFVRAVQAGREEEASKPFNLNVSSAPRDYLSVPLQTPKGYTAGDASPADLDGDGEYEIIIHMTGRGRDNSQSGFTRAYSACIQTKRDFAMGY